MTTQHTLTPRQLKFAQAYTSAPALFNASKASRLAGYSEKSCRDIGYENLRKPQIRAVIDQHLVEAYDATQITIKKVLADLEMVRVCAMRDGKYHAAIRATELQGKYLGMFSNRVERRDDLALDSISDSDLTFELLKLLNDPNISPDVANAARTLGSEP